MNERTIFAKAGKVGFAFAVALLVARPAPRGVPVTVLTASPSVKMNFHDSPANHHVQVVKQYPKNWKPDGENEKQSPKNDSVG